MTHARERSYRLIYLYHLDHHAAGAAALAAVYPDACNEFASHSSACRPERSRPSGCSAIPPTCTAVDVTDVFDAKVRACAAHGSQATMLDGGVADELRDELGRTAREHGLPEGRLAEANQVVDTP